MLRPTCTSAWMLVKEANPEAEERLTLILNQVMTPERLMKLPEERRKQQREEEEKSLLAIVPQKERQEEREKSLTRKSAEVSGRPDARTKNLASARPGEKEELERPEKLKKLLVRRESATKGEERGTLGGDESATQLIHLPNDLLY